MLARESLSPPSLSLPPTQSQRSGIRFNLGHTLPPPHSLSLSLAVSLSFSRSSEHEPPNEEPYEVHLILRSSPIPRKKSFLEKRDDEETCSKPPLTGCKVHFADRLGLDLVEVKFFEKFELSDYLGPSEVDLPKPEDFEFHIVPEFALPADLAQLLEKVRAQMVELESVETVEGDPLSIQGLVRVLNLDFVKTVHIRASLDSWATYYDYPAEYVSDQADTHTNLFRFRLSFVPPFVRDGARFEFAARYEVPEGVHWANNAGRNYSVPLHGIHCEV
uniref:CBM21 domain-containing protein n=1 Tax=Callorhinchus milii TaxID=7868 RepID=A0A4W3GK09_CALMI